MALPAGYAKGTIYGDPASAGDKRLYAVATTADDGASYKMTQIVDTDGKVYAELSDYRTVSLA